MDQIRSFSRALFSLATLMGVVAYWSNTFPLVELAAATPLTPFGDWSVLQTAQLGLVGLVTYVVARNVPGLLELTVLSASGIVRGTRYAIYTLFRYGALTLGVIFALQIIDIDWAQFGWFAAALSVGLGFGLQEIVANFISGLIILFERPIRVGDVVTVEGMTGTVSKIQMRSTTVVNWDRQEFVVPNKTLITNTLLNWTLSAPLNRVTIPVGVAYGSDTDAAMRIMVEAAREHDRVLDDPAPFATFDQFGESSLNLTLRAYLPDMDTRLGTITDLHRSIARGLAEAGIEIAFPQRDLHLRSGSFTAEQRSREEPGE